MKTITVTGASETQGSSVVSSLLETKEWKIRAVTRNPHSEATQALASRGVEIITGNYDDEETLVKAFEEC